MQRAGQEQAGFKYTVSRLIRTVLLAGVTFVSTLSIIPIHAAVEETTAVLDPEAAFKTSQAVIGQELEPFRLLTSEGKDVLLTDFIGKPLVVSLIYTSCHYVCPTLTRDLAQAVEIARDALGDDSFSVLTIGFDVANDTPDRMRTFRREQGINISDWTFASTDSATVEPLTQSLGFIYTATPSGFDHLMQTTVIDAEGKIHLQIYGDLSEAPTFVEPLKQLAWGLQDNNSTLDGWWQRTKLFCTVYDPATGRYEFDYSILIAIFVGTLTLGATLIFIVRSWRQSGHTRLT